MRSLTLGLLVLACGILCTSAEAASWTAVFSQEAHNGTTAPSGASLGLIDLGAIPPIGSSPLVAPNPFDVVIAPDASTAYIANFGTCGASSGNLVQAIDMSVSPPVAKAPIPLGTTGAFGVAVSPDGRTVYASGCGKVIPIDVSASPATLGTPITVPADPFSLVISRDGRTLWTANHSTGNVSVIDLAAPAPSVVKTIAVGTQPLGMALTPDGARLYVANGASCTISVIDTATETVSGAPIALPPAACSVSPQGYFGDPGRVVMSPDGATLYAASRDQQVVTPISTASNTAGTPISFAGVTTPSGPFKPGGLAMTPDGARLLVAEAADGPSFGKTVQVVSTPANTLSGTPIQLNSSIGFGIDGAVTPDQAPVADFTVSSAPPGSPTRFDASSSTVRYGTIATYEWDFGDGSAVQTTSTPTVEHTYASAGTYSATVTETDATGTSLPATSLMTGRTFARHGSESARTSRSAVVPADATQPAVTLSSSSLVFGNTGVGKAAAAQTLTLTNTGSAPLVITGSAFGGPAAADFKLSADTCTGATIAPAAACAVAVTFTPTAEGGRSAQVAFTDNASGSPHTIALSGQGTSLGTLLGTVTAAGKPLPGSTVRACVPPGFNDCRTATAAADGGYSLPGLPLGPRSIEVMPGSGSSASASGQLIIVAGDNRRDFALSAPQPIGGGLAFQTPGGTVGNGVPTVNWNEPFAFDVPVSIPASSSPNSLVVIPVAGRIALDPGDGTEGGFGLGAAGELAVRYDKSGAPVGIVGYDDNVSLGATASAAVAGASARAAKSKGNLATIKEAVNRFAAEQLDDETATISYSHPLAYGGSIEYKIGAHRGSVPSFFFHYKPPQLPKTCMPIPPELQKILDDANALADQVRQAADDIVNGLIKNTEIYLREDLGPQLGKAAQQALQDAESKLEGLGAQLGNQISSGIAGSGGGRYARAAAATPSPTMSAALLVDGAPALAAANDDGIVPLRAGRKATMRFTVASLDQQVHGAFQYGYYQNVVTLGSTADAVAGAAQDGDSCPDPPKPPGKPPTGKPNGGGGGGGYIDPSGTVRTTTGDPLGGAVMTLLRGDTATKLFKVPSGSTIMSPSNRRNPDRSDATGHFGWDVLAGFYQVTATHPGCRAAKGGGKVARTKVLEVPPPAVDLRLTLSCPHLKRTATKVSLRVLSRSRGGGALLARISTRRSGPAGSVTFRAGKRVLGVAPVDARHRTASLPLARRAKGHVTASYSGDAIHAPSRSR